MAHSNIDRLTETVLVDPHSAASVHAMEELTWEVLECLQQPDESRLRKSAEETGTVAQRWLAMIGDGPEAWLGWYAGQLQALASLLRAALLREIPLAALAMLAYKNVPALLRTLEEGDKTLSDLADAVGIDLSQVQREVSRLADRHLVRTVKGGRDRWVRLTSLGHRALARLPETSPKSRQIPSQSPEVPLSVALGHLFGVEGESEVADLSAQWAADAAREAKATEGLAAVAALIHPEPMHQSHLWNINRISKTLALKERYAQVNIARPSRETPALPDVLEKSIEKLSSTLTKIR
jgi:DNA-binding MarR family transcriptional regulator